MIAVKDGSSSGKLNLDVAETLSASPSIIATITC